MNVLFAVDGSAYTVKAAEYIATHFKECPGKLEIHLVNGRGRATGMAVAQPDSMPSP